MAESPLFRAILSSLSRGTNERFAIVLTDRLDLALKRAVSGPHPIAELSDALRLIVALDTRLASPTAASKLRSWLRRSSRALEIIRRDIAGASVRAGEERVWKSARWC